MYIKKLTIWFFMLLAMVSTACSDIRDIVGGGTQDLPSDGVVLTLKLPNFTKNTVATRANEQQQINSLCVSVSYTHLRSHETLRYIVFRLML